MNSMLVSKFMEIGDKELTVKQLVRVTIIFVGFGAFVLFFGGAVRVLGTLMILTSILLWVYKYGIKKLANRFQRSTLVKFENMYERRIVHALRKSNVYWYFGLTVLMLFAAFIFFGMSVGAGRTKIEFFPDNTPNQIIVYIEYPQGTAIEKTNKITTEIEQRVYAVLNDPEYMDGR